MRRALSYLSGKARWLWRGTSWREVVAVVAVLVLGAWAIYSAAENTRGRRLNNAQTAYETCRSVETVKTQIRETIEASRDQVAAAKYYRVRPKERAAALRQIEKTIKRFDADDCTKLPVTVDFTPRQLRR